MRASWPLPEVARCGGSCLAPLVPSPVYIKAGGYFWSITLLMTGFAAVALELASF